MAKSARDFFNRVANREKSIPRPGALAACRYILRVYVGLLYICIVAYSECKRPE